MRILEKTVNTEVSISMARRSDNNFVIEIQDQKSRLHIATLELTPENFAYAISSMLTTASAKIYVGPEIGKYKETKQASCIVENVTHNDLHDSQKSMALILGSGYLPPEGWSIDPNLRFRDSVERSGASFSKLNFTIFRFVDKE